MCLAQGHQMEGVNIFLFLQGAPFSSVGRVPDS